MGEQLQECDIRILIYAAIDRLSHILLYDCSFSLDLLKARMSRDLMTAAYLSLNTASSSITNVHDIVPYKVKMSSLAIHLPYDGLPEKLYLPAIYGQVVALCNVNSQQVNLSTIPLLLPEGLEI